MAVVLSVITAAIFGTGDFCGGLAARRASIVQVVALSHTVGLAGVLLAAVLVADELRAGDFGLGVAGGVFGGVGVALLYQGLARGPMSVVAPLTAITSAAVPALWGVAGGDRLSVWSWIGVALALFAIVAASTSDRNPVAPVTAGVIAGALTAGTCFGVFFILMDATAAETAPWPVVGARLVTTVSLLAWLTFTDRRVVPSAPGALGLIVATGVFDTASNVLFLYATETGQLTIVAVLSSLYPVATVLLARGVLGERMTTTQSAGFVSAVAAACLIAVG